MNIYEKCPELESENFLLRAVKGDDCGDLLKVYSDKNALPFFNSDNCDGDNFYYATQERMAEALDFWRSSYENRWFARLSIVDKAESTVVGTVELCLRVSEDEFDHMGILRVDVRSDYEKEESLYEIIALTAPQLPELRGCHGILTKAPIYAVERVKALQKTGFSRSEHLLIGKNGYAYDGYWTKAASINRPSKLKFV
ncbi:MAG: N-acetyltransferase [Firmicutes bacterium]|nr:N-acetyltransferase [Bacillota bacterium]